MDFTERLQRAVQRGQQTRAATEREQVQAALSEEESRALHAQARVELSDHIEACLRKVSDHFPGFEYQTVVSESGYGARIRRDDLRSQPGRGFAHEYSHLELLVRSYTPRRILELTGRGAVANKEVLHRSHFQFLNQLDLDTFRETIDHWVLEYAEKFAAR